MLALVLTCEYHWSIDRTYVLCEYQSPISHFVWDDVCAPSLPLSAAQANQLNAVGCVEQLAAAVS